MSKSLKTKIIVTIALVLIGFWVISGVLVRRHAASFVADQQSRIQAQGEQGQLLDELLREKHSLLRELAGIRVVTAMVALVTLSILLGLLWRRRVSRPMALLSDRIHKMRLGTWNDPIPIFQDDEMGTLVQQFNELGPELAFTAHQYAAASKLAAMALIGQRVVRRTMAARQRLLAVSEALSRRPGDERFQEIAVEQVRQVAGELESVATDFDAEFQAELERVGSSQGTTGGNRAA
jgi:methyl-accepting chemotaxis protein